MSDNTKKNSHKFPLGEMKIFTKNKMAANQCKNGLFYLKKIYNPPHSTLSFACL